MSIKKTMLAAALAAFAFAALPAIASAQPELEIEKSGHFELAGGHTELTTAGAQVTCTGVIGTGDFEGGSPSTTGTVSFEFTGCKSSGTSCGTVTAGSGKIIVSSLPFHLVTATDNEDVTGDGGDPVDALLITPKNPDESGTGDFTTFKCAFGLVTVQVKGTGVIGEIISPETEVASNTFEVEFAQHKKEDTQTYEHIEVGGQTSTITYDLESKVGSGAWETAVQIGKGTGTFTEGSKNTLIKG